MPTFEIEKDGKTFEIDAPTQAAALAGLSRLSAPAPRPSAAARFGSELYNKSPIPAVVGAVQGAANVVAHPLDTYFGLAPIANTVKDLAKAQWDEAVKAAQKTKEAVNGGGVLSASEAMGHGLAAILPILGPAAANVGEHGAAGDVAGMAGGATGLLAPFAAKAAVDVRNAPNPGKADIMRREAEQTVSQRVLAPGNPRYKGTADKIAPEVLSRKLQGGRVELQQIADEGMADAADRIDAAIQSRPAASNVVFIKPIVADLTRRIDDLAVAGKVIPTAAGRATQLTALRDYLAKQGNSMPFADLKRVRDEFYGAADAAKGYQQSGNQSIADTGWAAREAGSAIRSHLAKNRPELVGPNADYTFFKRLGDVLDPTVGRPKNVSASPTGVTGGNSTAGAIVGAAVAAGSHIPGLQGASALIASRLLPALIEARNSPAWQLASAQKKSAIADAIEAGQIGKAKSMLMSIAKSAPRDRTEPE